MEEYLSSIISFIFTWFTWFALSFIIQFGQTLIPSKIQMFLSCSDHFKKVSHYGSSTWFGLRLYCHCIHFAGSMTNTKRQILRKGGGWAMCSRGSWIVNRQSSIVNGGVWIVVRVCYCRSHSPLQKFSIKSMAKSSVVLRNSVAPCWFFPVVKSSKKIDGKHHIDQRHWVTQRVTFPNQTFLLYFFSHLNS